MSEITDNVAGNFDKAFLRAMVYAKKITIEQGLKNVIPEAFAIAILSCGKNVVCDILNVININAKNIVAKLTALMVKIAASASENPDHSVKASPPVLADYANLEVSDATQKIIQGSVRIKDKMGNQIVGVQHMLLSLLANSKEINAIFVEEGVNHAALQTAMKDMIRPVMPNRHEKDEREDVQDEGTKTKAKPEKESSPKKSVNEIIEKFCTDITAEASAGKLDPVIGRTKEVERVASVLCRKRKNNPVLVGEPGVGKAQPLDSLVLTSGCEWKTMGDLSLNDTIIVPSGEEARITRISPQGEKEILTIYFSDGRTAECCKEHLWEVYGSDCHNKNEIKTLATEQIIHKLSMKSYRNRIRIPLISMEAASNRPRQCRLISPYVLGVIIGDGNVTQNHIRIHCADEEIMERASLELLPDYAFSKFKTKAKGHSYQLVRLGAKPKLGKGESWNKCVLEIKRLGLFGKKSFSKFIPDEYKKASSQELIEMLQGLLDTDGYVSKNGTLMYATSSHRLACDIREVVWSLGGICHIRNKQPFFMSHGKRKKGRISYVLTIKHKNQNKFVFLPRKKARLKIKNQYAEQLGLKIVKIEKTSFKQAQCIYVDHPSHQYITNNFVVTHNSAIADGLAQRIVSGNVPHRLKGKRLIRINLFSVVANTQYRGQFEERMKQILQAFKSNPDFIMFIDEIHSIVGAGNASGALDAGNILKPALARGEVRCLGATTLDEYQKTIAKDGALERRFQTIMVDENTKEETIEILLGLKHSFELHHHCKISDDAVMAAVELSSRFIPDRRLPDKAIDCIDEACAKKSSQMDRKVNEYSQITKDDIVLAVAEQARLPVKNVIASEAGRVANIDKVLGERIIGQNEAIGRLATLVKNAYSGLRDPDRPMMSFVLGGPTQVGKTYTVEELTKEICPIADSLITINLSEYQERHEISRLIGSPPGYIGFGEKNQLTDKVFRRPNSIVLFDEIEKGHPEIIKILLQILNRGFINDSEGKRVSFKNTVIAMTTNLGFGNAKVAGRLGFDGAEDTAGMSAKFSEDRERLVEACKKQFGAEFVSRVDDFIPYAPFTEESLKRIAKIELDKLEERIKSSKGAKLVFADDLLSYIYSVSKTSHASNAASVIDVIRREIQPILSEELLKTHDDVASATIEMVGGKPVVIIARADDTEKGKKKRAGTKKTSNCSESSKDGESDESNLSI